MCLLAISCHLAIVKQTFATVLSVGKSACVCLPSVIVKQTFATVLSVGKSACV